MKKIVKILCIVASIFQTGSLFAQISFVTNGQSLTTTNAWDVQLVDIDGDKDIDAYIEQKVWLNDGSGNFSKTSTTFGVRDAYFADFNGDGKTDVVCNDSIYLNNGVKPFQYNFYKTLPTKMTMNYAKPADIDKDGDIDLIVAEVKPNRAAPSE